MYKSALLQNLYAPFAIAPWPLIAVIFFFSVVVHEVAHGYIALKCGDDTAKVMGRITLNPIVHVELFGTIILPVMLYFLGGFVIGWAKPVPINPYRFKDMKTGILKVGISGPATNFILAVIFSLIVWILAYLGFAKTDSGLTIIAVIAAGVTLNLILCFFNLIPIPPLDGSRVVSVFMPDEMAAKYEKLSPYGIFIIFLLLRVIWPFIGTAASVIYTNLFRGLTL